MKPVDQVITEGGKGDCLRASVATVLGLQSEQLPNFAEIGFFDGLDVWLKERGLRAIRLSFVKDSALNRAWVDFENDLVILWGESPRFHDDGRRKQHAVVGRPNGYGFEVVHDPHPSRDGLHGIPRGVMWIVPVGGVA
jgi:hypothetical protein